jgi:hypothetical protein
MPALILYLLKANIALVLFYLAYHLVLRKLTFYHLNRLFLVFGLLFASLYHFIDLSKQELAVAYTYTMAIPAWTAPPAIPEQTAAFDYWLIPIYLFWIGCAVMAARLLLQFASLYKIHAASIPAEHKGISFRMVKGIKEAFSFWQTIYLNPTQRRSPELESILRHEQIHVNGWHTLDVLLAELSTVFCWFNPGVWLLKKAMKENLEFIADQHVVDAGVDRKEYQYLLLKVVGASQPQIANQFNFPSLKRRIVMMNKKQTSLLHVLRYAVVAPLIVAPMLVFTAFSKSSEANAPVPVKEQTNAASVMPDSVTYFVDGKQVTAEISQKLDPKEIHNVDVLKGESAKNASGDKAAKNVISITTKKNKGTPEVLKFNEKISALSSAPVNSGASPAKQDQNEEYTYILGVTDDYYKDEKNLPEDYKAFLKRNPQVKRVGFRFNNRKDYDLTSFVVYLKSGKTEVYDYNRNPRIPAAEAKYGALPNLPPPPPPVQVKKN